MTESPVFVRPLRADDAGDAGALLSATIGATPYTARLLELLDQALTAPDDEVRGLVAEQRGAIAALTLHGAVAGSEGASRLHVLVCRAGPEHEAACDALLRAVVAESVAAGARFLVAEHPDDRTVASLVAPLLRGGFREEARVADFFRDGVDLLFLRLPLDGS